MGADTRGAAGDLIAHAQVAGDAGGERGLAQARRTVEQDVPQRFAPLLSRIDGDFQPRVHLALADHVAHPLRAQAATLFVIDGRLGGGGLKNGFAHQIGLKREATERVLTR